MNLNGPLKVNVGLTHGLHPMYVTPDGFKFNDAFSDRRNEKEEFFREPIILKINDIAGNDWRVCFVEEPVPHKCYMVDITVPNNDHLNAIVSIIIDAFPEYEFSFFRRTDHFEHLGRVKARL